MNSSPLNAPTHGLWWAAFLVGVVGVATFIAVGRTADDNRRVAHTNEVLYHLETLISALKDAETGQRGYIITGREEFLQPYYAAKLTVPREFGTLRRLTRDNPVQQGRLDQLQPIMLSRLHVLTVNVGLRRSGGLTAAQTAIRQGNGRRMMEDIRHDVGIMEATERTLLAQRSSAAARTSLEAGIIALGGAVILFALVVYNTAYIQDDIRRRIELERSLRQTEERLSITLYSIGDAVIAVDAHGCVTLMNPFAQQISGWLEDSALGRDHSEVFRVVNESTGEPVDSPIAQVLRDRKPIVLANHAVLLRRDGGEVPIDDSAAPIFDADGDLLGAILVFRDITQRRNLDQALQREADLANAMQVAALPSEVPAVPGLDIAPRYQFAKEVGGDFYLFLPNGDRLDMVLGDVSGKGTPAALAATSIAHLLPWLRPPDDPLTTLRKLNEDLLERLPDNSFATMVLAEADAGSGTLRLWNAGHPPALMWSATKGHVCCAERQNPLLGVFPAWKGEHEDFAFDEGDVLVLYSDGLSETRNEAGDMFESEIPAVISKNAASSAGEIADSLLAAAESWGPRTDDLTLLVCKRLPISG